MAQNGTLIVNDGIGDTTLTPVSASSGTFKYRNLAETQFDLQTSLTTSCSRTGSFVNTANVELQVPYADSEGLLEGFVKVKVAVIAPKGASTALVEAALAASTSALSSPIVSDTVTKFVEPY